MLSLLINHTNAIICGFLFIALDADRPVAAFLEEVQKKRPRYFPFTQFGHFVNMTQISKQSVINVGVLKAVGRPSPSLRIGNACQSRDRTSTFSFPSVAHLYVYNAYLICQLGREWDQKMRRVLPFTLPAATRPRS